MEKREGICNQEVACGGGGGDGDDSGLIKAMYQSSFLSMYV